MKKALLIIISLALVLGGCGSQEAALPLGTLPEVSIDVGTAEASPTATSEAPATVEPTTPSLTTEEPTTEEPATESRADDTSAPMTETEETTPSPATEEPATEEPATESRADDTSAPTTESEETMPSPTTEEPTTEEPTTEEPTTEVPATEEPTTEEPNTEEPTTEEPATEEPTPEEGYLICIDPGHQARPNYDLEPQAPGSDIMKSKVSDGTKGISSGIRESVVNLTIALQLRDELLSRGYRVIMTRTTEEVDISNIERAQMANEAGADAFLRLHCDGSEDTSWNGSAIFCQHPYSDYNGHQYEASKRLCEILLTKICERTGFANRGVTEAYHYTGINWSKVPGGLIEMGFLTNYAEEQKLLDPVYQQLLVQAMADGLDQYFGR